MGETLSTGASTGAGFRDTTAADNEFQGSHSVAASVAFTSDKSADDVAVERGCHSMYKKA